jgi:hypothetical protein
MRLLQGNRVGYICIIAQDKIGWVERSASLDEDAL